jgi:hypothetical protein
MLNLMGNLKSSVSKKLLTEYVTKYIWEGYLFVDGGWGDKNMVTNIFPKEDLLVTPDVFVQPVCEFTENNHSSMVDQNHKYKVVFPGYNYPLVIRYTSKLTEICEEQLWVLDSFSRQNEETVFEPYRMEIFVGPSESYVKVYKGVYKPDFSEKTLQVGWEI